MPRMTKKIETGTAARTRNTARIPKVPGCRRSLPIAAFLFAFLLAATVRHAQAQTKLGPAAPVTYDNKYEIYAGLNYMNFKAGKTCPSA